jgi:carboxyl-terminal processing protease
MMKRSLTFATLAFALAASAVVPAASAQDMAMADRPPEVEVLRSAVNAISRMHMETFSDSVLWSAALEGVAHEVAEEYRSMLEGANGDNWQDLLAQAVAKVSTTPVDNVPDSVLWEAAIDGMIDVLDDPYAELFTPAESEQWEESTTGNYSGIGLQITLLNDAITVTAVFRGFPASEHGISVGDVIVGVGEHDASEWGTDMAADSIRGPVGTDVAVRIKRAGYDQPLSYSIERAEVHVPAVNWGVLESGIGYVIMDRVARNAAQEMSEALAELQDHRGLIIDLRRNPGGFLDESLMLADLFLKPGSTLASTVQRVPGSEGASSSETQAFRDQWPQMVPDLPIVVLVDEFTASGAEILAGALQDYDRAVVLGERSFGKGVVQTVMNLPHRRRLRFTTGTWLTPLGRSLQRSRDSQGVPLVEDMSEKARVETPAGRSLIDGGGIFPDVEIQDDTLRLPEQELIRVVTENEFPLGLRLAEFGFEVAASRREAGEPPSIQDAEFEALIADLVSDGLPAELLEDPMVLDYLRWRGQMAVAQRMDDIGAEADIRTVRDPVLTAAIRLLSETNSQAELFRATEALGERAMPEPEVRQGHR